MLQMPNKTPLEVASEAVNAKRSERIKKQKSPEASPSKGKTIPRSYSASSPANKKIIH
jgi:hypothetical protein